MVAKKSLLERLEEEHAKQPNSRSGVVSVLAHKDEIAEALNKGFTVKKIYQIMARDGEVSVSYQSFARLVGIYIKGKEKSGKRGLKTSPTEPKGIEQLSKNKGPRPDHVYNPDNYDEDELV